LDVIHVNGSGQNPVAVVIPDMERLAGQVRGSLLVDPNELRDSESVRSKTANAAAAIAQQMAGYMAGYSVSEQVSAV
jgi:hypothetical protein